LRLQRGDFFLDAFDVGISLWKSFPLGEVAPQLIQSAGGRRFRIAERGRRIRRHISQQRGALVERAEEPLAVQSQLHVEPLERRQVHFGLLR